MSERDFASDNNAGIHPAVLAAIAAANRGHVPGYGDDPYTAAAEAAFRAQLGDAARVFFCFNGTGANVVALSAALRPHQGIICPEFAHLSVDECGAYERFGGGKLLTVPVHNGKLTPDDVESAMRGVGDQHHVQPGAISISQSTEVGTVYTLDEMRALGETAHRHGLLFHVDGARLANAAVALGAGLRALLVETGVDICTFGGTKNGLLCGEAVIFPRDHAAARVMPFARKSGMQLASKMRFVAAQFNALLANDLWRVNAAHANRMAKRLERTLHGIERVRPAYPVEANGVFAEVPAHAVAPLQAERHFYVWDAKRSIVRWMTAWDTTEDDVDRFATAIERVAGEPVPA